MGIIDRFFGRQVVAQQESRVHAEAGTWLGLDDPRVVEFLRFGDMTATGVQVNVERALKNPAMFRAVSLISNSIGMLPVHLIDDATKVKAKDHPLYAVLHRRPNGWQSGFDFKSVMQLWALAHGDACALIVRSPDMSRRSAPQTVRQLIPLPPERMRIEQRDDLSVVYRYQPKSGGAREYAARDIFHLRGLSLNGLHGLSMVRQAGESIALALAADLAAGRMFKNGLLAGTALESPKALSDTAYARLMASLAEKEGAANAGKNLILEEGMKLSSLVNNARSAQLIEVRKMQVEEIGRFSGVPRPLLMVDDTSWGSGIYALGQFFVQYALSPWFEAWQQAAERSLLDDGEQGKLSIKFNAGALLRGSIQEQGEFFAKALGAGGQRAFMSQNEVRDALDYPASDTDGANDLGVGLVSASAPSPVAATAPAPKPKPKPEDEGDDDDED